MEGFKIKIKVKNNATTKRQISLFDFFLFTDENCGLPIGIDVSVQITNEDSVLANPPSARKVTYRQLFDQIVCQPIPVKVDGSTNNRQLYFFYREHMGNPKPMEPGLTIDRKPRPQMKVSKSFIDSDGQVDRWKEPEYTTKWDPEKWNIADTKELFVLDNRFSLDLTINPNQLFIIKLEKQNGMKLHTYLDMKFPHLKP